MDFWITLLYLLLGAVIGGGLTFFFTRKMFIQQMKDNPPINEKMIRAMYAQMGRKPSEKQVRQIMNSFNQYK